ncbi:MAG: pyridoxal phosphate-dependent aminotransferase [Gammaproteobacteria bacterium]|nr:pyridoxal phosphate-dependent aminotransferase [Gammaproteobacteria bacterium]
MAIQLSDTLALVKPSPTLAITARAAALRAEGQNIISMSVGEPDFDTPEHIKQAAIKAIQDGFTKYTAVDGMPRLKKAIQAKFANENRLNYELKEIIVSAGAKQVLYNLFQALLNPGDEVIIPAPYWVSYPDMAYLAKAKPVIIDTDIDAQFKITPEQLEKAITPKTRLFIINSPSNPSGMAYSADELAALGEVLKKHPQIVIATDDIYEHILWPGNTFYTLLNVTPELKDRTMVVNGASKAYAMTGWRIGYAAGPASLIAAMEMIQSQSTSNPCSISQVAAAVGLESGTACITEMVVAFKRRHDILIAGLNELPGVRAIPVDGTFYAYPDVREAMKAKNFKTDVEFSEFLLVEAKVAVVPGSAFGTPGYIRLSYATSDDNIHEAVKRFKAALG